MIRRLLAGLFLALLLILAAVPGLCKTIKECLTVFKCFKTQVTHLEEISFLIFQNMMNLKR